MNIEEYMNSGIIEDYCLGILGVEQMLAVAQNAAVYAEIRMEIEEYELVLKRYAEGFANEKG